MVAGVPERLEAANVVGVTDRSLVCSLSTCGSGATLSAASKQVLTCACTVLKRHLLVANGTVGGALSLDFNLFRC